MMTLLPPSLNTHESYSSISECLKCAALCNQYSVYCLEETSKDNGESSISQVMACAAMCFATAQMLSLRSDKAPELCRICAEVCLDCAAECVKHGHEYSFKCMEQCRVCAAVCLEAADLVYQSL